MQADRQDAGPDRLWRIAAEVARIALGSGMCRDRLQPDAKKSAKIEFVELDELWRKRCDSLHLLLNDETRGFVSRACIEAMKPGVILITRRVRRWSTRTPDGGAWIGQIRHAGLDVSNIEPLAGESSADKLRNVTLSAHSAFRTPEASET